MFEITGATNYILPTMITLMIAKSVADMFGKPGNSEAVIHMNRFPFVDQKEEYY
jgi:chloride channel 3/4/5